MNDVVRKGLRLAVGGALLYYLLAHAVDLDELFELAASPGLLAALVGLASFGSVLEAGRLRALMGAQGIGLTALSAWRLVLVGLFFGYFIPGGTGGDVVKLYYVAAEHRGRTVEAATALLVDRALALLALLAVIVVLSALHLDAVLAHAALTAIALGALGGLVVMAGAGLLASSRRLRRGRFYRFLTGLPLGGVLARMSDAMGAFRDARRDVLRAAAAALGGQLVIGLGFALVGQRIGEAVAPSLVALLGLTASIANAIPITPGGLGLGEAAGEGLLGVVGFESGALVILAWRAATVPMLVAGGLLYAAGPRRLRPPAAR